MTLESIWYLVLICLGSSVTFLVLLHIKFLFQGRHKSRQVHVSQGDLTDFLYECAEEFGENPVWSERCAKNKQEIL